MKGGKAVVKVTMTKEIKTEVITTVITYYLEAKNVPQLSKQRQSKKDTGIASLQCGNFLTKQEEMVTQGA
jgi:hypothetical protein